MRFRTLLLGALLALPLAPGAAVAQSTDPAAKPGAVAYPGNPSGTPAAGDEGAPIVTDRAACPTNTKCPDKPAPSQKAGSASSPGEAQTGAVRTPAVAYPNNPDPTPGANPDGTAPK